MDTISNENVSNTNPLEKPPVSDKKREANRQNSLKSTGPRTPRGKANSALNATKHGFYVKNANFELSGENVEEFADLCQRFRWDLHPCGAFEELEVERIAMCHWKLQRLWRFENALISFATQRVMKRQIEDEKRLCSLLESTPADASTSSAPTEVSADGSTLTMAERLQEIEFEVEIDAHAVPDPVHLEIIHRAEAFLQKSLNDAFKRYKSARKFRLNLQISDNEIPVAWLRQHCYDEDEAVPV